MYSDSVKTAFDQAAQTYDRARRQLIPCFEDFYGTVLALMPYPSEAAFRVLDLGAGTGLLSWFVARQFPNAHLTLLDISAPMLDKARERLAGLAGRCHFIVADYAERLQGEFEVVVSALSIHHLTDAHKAMLFDYVYTVLTPGGVFINADQVLGATPAIDRCYRDNWLRQVRLRGVSEMDLQAALERMREDRMAPLDAQLSWLREAGFEAVHNAFQQDSFVVFTGRKGAHGSRTGDL
jgi:tRNA (cmo5U34)-methyltransferase